MCYISLDRQFLGEFGTIITLFARIEMPGKTENEKSGPSTLFCENTEKWGFLGFFRPLKFRKCYYSVDRWLSFDTSI